MGLPDLRVGDYWHRSEQMSSKSSDLHQGIGPEMSDLSYLARIRLNVALYTSTTIWEKGVYCLTGKPSQEYRISPLLSLALMYS